MLAPHTPIVRVVANVGHHPMAVGVVSSPWSLEELLDALLSAEPCDPPHVQPLVHPKPAESARELPGGRGWLRALPGGNGATTVPGAPPPAPAAPATPAAVPVGPPPDERQLDLLSWKPKAKLLPPKGTQLSLFGESEG